MEQIDDGALVPVSDVKRKIHRSFPTTIATTLFYFISLIYDSHKPYFTFPKMKLKLKI